VKVITAIAGPPSCVITPFSRTIVGLPPFTRVRPS
jgi:hypothetical protein